MVTFVKENMNVIELVNYTFITFEGTYYGLDMKFTGLILENHWLWTIFIIHLCVTHIRLD